MQTVAKETQIVPYQKAFIFLLQSNEVLNFFFLASALISFHVISYSQVSEYFLISVEEYRLLGDLVLIFSWGKKKDIWNMLDNKLKNIPHKGTFVHVSCGGQHLSPSPLTFHICLQMVRQNSSFQSMLKCTKI